MTVHGGRVRLQIPSLFYMVDLVQVLSDRNQAAYLVQRHHYAIKVSSNAG